MIEVALLRELFDYQPDTGKFIRKVARSSFQVGTEAGYRNSVNGKITLTISDQKVSASAAAFAYMTGAWPTKRVVHLNGIPDDCRWANLYVSTKQPLTADKLRLLFHYEPSTGIFTRRFNTSSKGRAGNVAGCRSEKRGHVEFNVDGKVYAAHRLAWLYMTGEWPREDIDHINGDRADNRWSNLRDVDNATNMQNRRRADRDNKCGFLGVSRRRSGACVAQIGSKYLGSRKTPQEAHDLYLSAKRSLHDGNTL